MNTQMRKIVSNCERGTKQLIEGSGEDKGKLGGWLAPELMSEEQVGLLCQDENKEENYHTKRKPCVLINKSMEVQDMQVRVKNYGGLSVHEGTEGWEMRLKPFMTWITCGSCSLVSSYSPLFFFFEQRDSFDLGKKVIWRGCEIENRVKENRSNSSSWRFVGRET